MQVVRFLIAYGVVSALGILVSVFLAQNTQTERLTFFGQDVSTSLAWIMIGATAFGFLFALLLLLPGRISATLHIWALRREAKELDEELVWQGEQRDELLTHHERLLAGHEWLLSVYQRMGSELDRVVKERDALRVQLATSNTSGAHAGVMAPRLDHSAASSAPGARLSAAPAALRTRIEPSVPVAVAQEEAEEHDEDTAVVARVRPALAPVNERLEAVQEQPSVALQGEAESDKPELAPPSAPTVETDSPRMRLFGARLAAWLQAVSRPFSVHLRPQLVLDGVVQAAANFRRRCASVSVFVQERWRAMGAKVVEQRRRAPSPSHPT
jgi:uncharacterized integral membrane protein